MGRILTAACLTFLCVACDSAQKRVSPARPAAPPPCGLAVVWHGVRYVGRAPAGTPVQGHSLGAGGVPSCRDVLGGETGASRAVEVRTLVGVEPRVAITVEGDALHVYVAGHRSSRSRRP